jgi:flagellar hook-basal body complex protein FliE
MIPAISSALGSLDPGEWTVGGIGGAGLGGAGPTGSGSFANALSGALDSLQQTQTSAAGSAQALATGQATDPTQAVTAVENASLAMDLASQISSKLTAAANTIFQTQV